MTRPETEYWIPELKKGALSRQLGIPERENIPKSLLWRIRRARVGATITNPSPIGKRQVKVTRLLKRRAVLALKLKEFQEPRFRRSRVRHPFTSRQFRGR